ncbi:UxaA family hydrolase [Nocardia vaccinii]|uniref:UxaA family hydrolase n=1 Tax=Nocardia vaccinii TaxID=1822 RepID=UPI00082D519D|nr:UxaA family hydrolase [Nocardia vaccinii]
MSFEVDLPQSEHVQLLVLDARDNIAIAITDLHVGGVATVGDRTLTVRDNVSRGHKVALVPIRTGADVIRYGETVGVASADIEVGDHVHVHNVLSKRLPGRTQ